MKPPVKVHVLHSEACLRTPPTIERVKKMAQNMGVSIELTEVEVNTFDEIMEYEFIGSPTVRINGKDIDASSRRTSVGGFI